MQSAPAVSVVSAVSAVSPVSAVSAAGAGPVSVTAIPAGVPARCTNRSGASATRSRRNRQPDSRRSALRTGEVAPIQRPGRALDRVAGGLAEAVARRPASPRGIAPAVLAAR